MTDLWLFLGFLVVGFTGFGGGYAMVPLMKEMALGPLHLPERVFLQGLAIGQLTPGPVAITATFLGAASGGWPGALLATAAVFLPTMVMTALVLRLSERLRQAVWRESLLHSLLATVIGLIAALAVELARSFAGNPALLILAVASFFLSRQRWMPYGVLILLAAGVGIAIGAR